MSFEDAIRSLNKLKRQRVIRDYSLIGAVAATYYGEPISTEDLDIVILVDSDDEYIRAYRKIGEAADGLEGMHYILGDVPVQIFPSTVKPLYQDVVTNAHEARSGSLRVKIATAEHLVLLLLEAYRPKDKARLPSLLVAADDAKIRELLLRFDDEQATLTKRLEALRGEGI